MNNLIPNLRDYDEAEASPKSLLHILIGRGFIPRTDHVGAYKMSPYITGFTPKYGKDMAVKVNFLENRIFVLIYKIKLIQFILLILSKKDNWT